MEPSGSRPKRDGSDDSQRQSSGHEDSPEGSRARSKKQKAESPGEVSPVRSMSSEVQRSLPMEISKSHEYVSYIAPPPPKQKILFPKRFRGIPPPPPRKVPRPKVPQLPVPDPMGPFTFEEKRLAIEEEVGFSHWTSDPRAVLYYSGTRRGSRFWYKHKVAIRMVNENCFDEDDDNDQHYLECFRRERSSFDKLAFKFIAMVYDKFYYDELNEVTVIVQEWFDENLVDRINRHKETPMTPADVRTADRPFFQLQASGVDLRNVKLWMGQIAQAIEYVHAKGYVHNRIEPNSVMIRGRDKAVLSHFLCFDDALISGNKPTPFMNMKYASPQLVQHRFNSNVEYDPKANDVWGFGCTCAFALTGNDLFNSVDPMDQPLPMSLQHRRRREAIEALPIRGQQKTFLKSILNLPEYINITISDVVKDPWFDLPVPHPSSPSSAPALNHDIQVRLRSFGVLGHSVDRMYQEMALKGYAISYLIGKGGYGAVYAGTKSDNWQLIPVAVKVLGGWNKRRQTKKYRIKYYPTELRVLSQLKHPNLVQVFDVFKEKNTHERTYERRTFIWMERSKSDLFLMACERPDMKLPEDMLAPLIAYALIGLQFLHDNKIAHRDIKPPNILVFETENGQIAKLTDYSLIKEGTHDTITHSNVGTNGYKSPAMLSKIGYNPFKADVFAMGITIFELLVGRQPRWNTHVVGRDDVLVQFQRLKDDVDIMFEQHRLELLFETIFTLEDNDRAIVQEVLADSWFPPIDIHNDPLYQAEGAIRTFQDFEQQNPGRNQ